MAITISGQNNNDKILASDGVLDQISGFNVVGVLTASTFETTGEITANHIDVGSSIQLGNAGIITATTLIGNVTGNVNSTSNLLFQISGSEKFRVGNGGQLGIGGANYGTSGQVLTSGGSGSAPTWSTIASDKITEGNTEAEVVDTGSDGHFKVKTEGSERIRIDSVGRVMIGTIDAGGSNADDLTVATSGNTGITIRSGTSNTGNIFFSDATSGAAQYAGAIEFYHSDNSLRFNIGNTNYLRITSTGFVGIGEDEPDSLLHIGKGTNADDGAVTLTIGGSSANTRQSTITKNNVGSGDRALEIRAATGSSNETIKFFSDNTTERLRITSDGKFGFGTSSPDQTVHIHKGSAGSVSSTANTVLTLENSTTNVLQFLNPNNTAAQLRFGDPEDDGIGFIEYSHNANTMSFGVYGPTRMQLDSNGHMGIAVASGAQLANSKQLTLRPSDDDGIRFVRPGDGNNNPNVHLDLTTTTSGSAYPSGEAYTVKYRTYNCDQIFETYEGGGTGGHIAFKTAPQGGTATERLIIDHDGYVTKPNNPSFKAYKSGATLSINANTVIVYDNVSSAGGHNTGTHYNTSNGRFTAPIAGKYFISMGHIMEGSYTNNALYIRVNGSQVTSQHFTQSGSWHGTTLTAYVNLNANDYVDTIFTQNTTYYGGTWSHFAGHLVQ